MPAALEVQPPIGVEADPGVGRVELLLDHDVLADEAVQRHLLQSSSPAWSREPFTCCVSGYLMIAIGPMSALPGHKGAARYSTRAGPNATGRPSAQCESVPPLRAR